VKTEDEQKAVVHAYRDLNVLVIQDIARLVAAEKSAAHVLARIIQMRGKD